MKDMIKNIITGKDNKTVDIARLLWLVCTITVIGGWVWDIIHNNVIHIADFGQAVAVIAGAFGASLYMKKDTEPEIDKNDKKE